MFACDSDCTTQSHFEILYFYKLSHSIRLTIGPNKKHAKTINNEQSRMQITHIESCVCVFNLCTSQYENIAREERETFRLKWNFNSQPGTLRAIANTHTNPIRLARIPRHWTYIYSEILRAQVFRLFRGFYTAARTLPNDDDDNALAFSIDEFFAGFYNLAAQHSQVDIIYYRLMQIVKCNH